MARVSLTFRGLDGLTSRLAEIDARLHGDWRPLLAARGQDMVTAFADNIRTEGARLADRGVTWPSLHPVTQIIRRHYGHGAAGPRLVRGGDLLLSLGVLDLGATYVEVGSTHHAARTVHEGGTVTDPQTGRPRTVQAFPFVLPTTQDLEDWTTLVADWFLADDSADAAGEGP